MAKVKLHLDYHQTYLWLSNHAYANILTGVEPPYCEWGSIEPTQKFGYAIISFIIDNKKYQ